MQIVTSLKEKSHENEISSLRKHPFLLAFSAGDVLRGETSVTQRHKFHTDDVKSVRNPVRRADWSTE